eukprot:GDKH01001568.1.p1 GENE.GDKH01001568.1~~GDKH01001568.1.p1  ORF type:complete len:470 (+),score=70.78 GDKH01001568.1:101-1510(+)
MPSNPSVRSTAECPVCLENFTRPRHLPCGHTFCEGCISQQLRGQQLTCPLCRVTHTVPDVSRLPRNLVAQELADSLGTSGAPCKAVVMCDSEDNAPATKWCQSCEGVFCDECWARAHSVAKLRSHTPQAVAERDQAPSDRCPSHTKYLRDFWCATCDESVCQVCLVDDHPQPKHQVSSMVKRVAQVREQLKAQFAKILTGKAGLENAAAQLNAADQRLAVEIEELETQLKKKKTERGKKQTAREQLLEKAGQVEAAHELLVRAVEKAPGPQIVTPDGQERLVKEADKVHQRLFDTELVFVGKVCELNPDSFVGVAGSFELPAPNRFVKKSEGHCGITVSDAVHEGVHEWNIEYAPTVDQKGWFFVGFQDKPKAYHVGSHVERDTYIFAVKLRGRSSRAYMAGVPQRVTRLAVRSGDVLTVRYDCSTHLMTLTAPQGSHQLQLPAATAGRYLHFNPHGASFTILSHKEVK